MASTEGFNAICINTEESQMEFLEIGGSESLRSYWKMYLPKVLLLVYVVDSADHARLPMAKQLLHQLIQNNSTLPVVVLANKQDLEVPPYTSYIPVRPRSRIHVLAEPKPVFCESSPRLAWGDQETIWTLSWGALTARPSARILSLSKPKTDFSKYRCRPVIGGRSPLAKFGYPSERLLRLAEPKKYLPAYLEKRARESPEWPVSLAAQNYNASQRILELARPKGLHPDFVPAREVSRLPQKAIASPRTIELSKPRQLPAKYAPPRDPEWPVTEAAKRAVARPRVLELAQPSTRPRMGLTTLNPDAFRVKEAAKKAVCSPRLQELARPIQR
ncbi:PREDICTED: testicular haploid expressed gene protein-like isoform X2 [Ficedula albicollis]|uniref:testicular haploid expressed gene protein-like isoform X2 n=1 Tax=Ficedula albicollis TaxID=59894 RepID=UPI000359D166|nr:PREDICTED: testicular haploid expressed gene protein-like isoform X2 [Ficedula albicollis]